MTKLIWVLFTLFLIGNSFFVLPFHYTSNSVVYKHLINYRKDSGLIHAVFPDSIVRLQLNMPASYASIYRRTDSSIYTKNKPPMVVNVSFIDDLDFFSLMFPFYKLVNINGQISFYSIVKVQDQPDRDSTALIGNIRVFLWLSVKGICTPLYVRTLVEEQFVNILNKEMVRISEDINRPPVVDTIAAIAAIKKPRVQKMKKARKNLRRR